MYFLCLLALSFLIGSVASSTCESRDRETVKFYWDGIDGMCYSYPVGCETPFKITQPLYDTEEECTLEHMVRMWKTYTISCPMSHRMAVYSRSNGDKVPFIFSSRLCRSSSGITKSDICNKDETCYDSHQGFAWCCEDVAYKGDGPSHGTFNFTGLGGARAHISRAVVTRAPPQPPKDCNLEGGRKEIEWYPSTGMMCISRRRDCSTPSVARQKLEKSYATQQECMDENFAIWRMNYKLTCSPGFSASASPDGVPIVFHKEQCGSHFQSDMCDHNEYCAYRSGSPFAFCCKKSSKYHIVDYTVYGKKYTRRHRREARFVL